MSDHPAERVRVRIREWMETTEVSQRDFAADLGKTQVWLQKILKGDNQVRLADLDAVADAMRTTASELVRTETDRYQLELTPTEVRLLEKLRRRPEAFAAIVALLHVHPANPRAVVAPQEPSPAVSPRRRERKGV